MDGYCEHYWLQASTFTCMTLALTHKALDVFAHKLTVCFFVTTLKIRDYAFIDRLIRTATTKVYGIFLRTSTIKHLV
ncbi:hypothetical protein D3C72_1130570 [compost metagenome]